MLFQCYNLFVAFIFIYYLINIKNIIIYLFIYLNKLWLLLLSLVWMFTLTPAKTSSQYFNKPNWFIILIN